MIRTAPLLLLALLAPACNRQPQGNDSIPSTGNTAATLRDYPAEQREYLSRLNPAEGWQATPSGLRYRRIGGTGQGPKPKPTDTVTLHYTGTLTDGTVFDSSVASGEPLTMALPALIQGWQEGVPLMGVGDKYEFAIPAELAYGPMDSGPIPGGSTLLFTIDLIRIEPGAGG